VDTYKIASCKRENIKIEQEFMYYLHLQWTMTAKWLQTEHYVYWNIFSAATVVERKWGWSCVFTAALLIRWKLA